MAANSVSFNARRVPGGASAVSFDAQNEQGQAPHSQGNPHVANGQGQLPPAPINPALANDGLHARPVVIVQLPLPDGTTKDYVLSVLRVNSDGSRDYMNDEYEYAELERMAAKIQALALEGRLFGKDVDFSDIPTIRFGMERESRSVAFQLTSIQYQPQGASFMPIDKELYDIITESRQKALAELGKELAELDNQRRSRSEENRRLAKERDEQGSKKSNVSQAPVSNPHQDQLGAGLGLDSRARTSV